MGRSKTRQTDLGPRRHSSQTRLARKWRNFYRLGAASVF